LRRSSFIMLSKEMRRKRDLISRISFLMSWMEWRSNSQPITPIPTISPMLAKMRMLVDFWMRLVKSAEKRMRN
jgi:hypothetical protein